METQELQDAAELLERVEQENRQLGRYKNDYRRPVNCTEKLKPAPKQPKPRHDGTEGRVQI